jgi:hypothetical protein
MEHMKIGNFSYIEKNCHESRTLKFTFHSVLSFLISFPLSLPSFLSLVMIIIGLCLQISHVEKLRTLLLANLSAAIIDLSQLYVCEWITSWTMFSTSYSPSNRKLVQQNWHVSNFPPPDCEVWQDSVNASVSHHITILVGYIWTAVKIVELTAVTSCNFLGIWCPILLLKMEALDSSETLVETYKIVRCHYLGKTIFYFHLSVVTAVVFVFSPTPPLAWVSPLPTHTRTRTHTHTHTRNKDVEAERETKCARRYTYPHALSVFFNLVRWFWGLQVTAYSAIVLKLSENR